MSGMTSYLQKKILDHILGITPYTAPTPLYLSLHTTSPTDTGSLAGEISSSGTAYARQAITTHMNATDSTSGISTNSAVLAFPTITGTYGTVTYIGISDALTAGNMLFWGTISEPQNKGVGESYQFAINQIFIQAGRA